jgi:hypothetical protein
MGLVFEFHWTDDSEAHIAGHSVAPEEVKQATERPFYTMPGRDGTTRSSAGLTRDAIYWLSFPGRVMAAGTW